LALAAGGDVAAAMQVYRDLRALLHEELNAAPAPETTEVFEQIRADARARAAGRPGVEDGGRPTPPRHQPSASPPHAAPAGSSSAPVPSPPLPGADEDLALTSAPGSSLQGRLPRPLTGLVGRRSEAAEVRACLACGETIGEPGPASRLVTLTGAGGV